MADMPIPQDYDRHIDPIEDMGALGEVAEVDLFDESIQEMDDGSAVVNLDDLKTPEESPDFYSNMADELDSYELGNIALKYIELVEKDKEAREERDKQYEDGLRRTGMGNDAPGGAQFNGASRVVHPVMAEGCVYDMFDRKFHVVSRNPYSAQFYIVGVDYGAATCTAAVVVDVQKGVSARQGECTIGAIRDGELAQNGGAIRVIHSQFGTACDIGHSTQG